MEQVAKDHGPLIKVAKINVDQNGEIAQRYGIRGIPSVMIFKNGKIVQEARPDGSLGEVAMQYAY